MNQALKGQAEKGQGLTYALAATAKTRPSKAPKAVPAKDMRIVAHNGATTTGTYDHDGGTMAAAISKKYEPRRMSKETEKPVLAAATNVKARRISQVAV